MKKLTYPAIAAVFSALVLSLSACSDPDTTASSGNSASADATAQVEAAPVFDVEQLQAQPEIVALVPQAVKDRNQLRNGASTDYAPAEFRDTDGRTPVGYDVDINRALAKVMGLEDAVTEHAEFPTIIPALGSKFDVGISSFTITPERLEQVNMVSYVQVGSTYAVKNGNPSGFDPNNPCGATIGVQTGTYQHDYANELSEQCVANGKEAIKVMPHDLNTDAITKLIGGQYDAVLSDSTVTGYAVSRTNGQIEQVGDVIEAEPQGVAIAKSDQELTEAVAKAMQYLMDKGYLKQILDQYGAGEAALSEAAVNPGK